jgi:high-affinity iron transporter
VLPTFIIGLREGLEASLIVGIIAAFLIQRGERRALRPMWLGVGLAIALCLGAALVLEAVNHELPHKQQEGLATVLALLAVLGVTYMVVWMKRHSRALKGSLERSAASALLRGSVWALVGMAFFAVLREGLETSVFLLAVFGSSTHPAATGSGAALGIAVAVALGYAIYRGGIRINLGRFFRVTGFVLVLVAAGLLATAVHTGHEASWIDSLQAQAVDLRWLVAPNSVRAALLTGMLGLQPVPTVGEVLAWLLYAVPMALFVLWPPRQRLQREPQPATVNAT